MMIANWTDEKIEFSDGSSITYEHEPDCCEVNYADFSVLDVMYHGEEFDDYHVQMVEYGFNLVLVTRVRFGYIKKSKIYIPFYSEQNGYYSDECDLIVTGKDRVSIVGNECLETFFDQWTTSIPEMSLQDELAKEHHLNSVVCEICGVIRISKSREFLEEWIGSHVRRSHGTKPSLEVSNYSYMNQLECRIGEKTDDERRPSR